MTQEPLAYVDHQAVSIRDMPDLVTKVEAALSCDEGFTLYTLNMDHLVKRRRNRIFRDLYARATFVTADGWPVAYLARRSTPSIQRTTGADLVVPMCRLAARCRVPVAFFGTSQAVLERAATRLRIECPGLDVVAYAAPPLDFDPLSSAGDAAVMQIAASAARLCFVALGAPKQEIFSDRALADCPATGFVCVGAALDFIAGAHHRAPLVLQRSGFEWAWRLILQPRRLAIRYLQCALLFAKLFFMAERSPVPAVRRVDS